MGSDLFMEDARIARLEREEIITKNLGKFVAKGTEYKKAIDMINPLFKLNRIEKGFLVFTSILDEIIIELAVKLKDDVIMFADLTIDYRVLIFHTTETKLCFILLDNERYWLWGQTIDDKYKQQQYFSSPKGVV